MPVYNASLITNNAVMCSATEGTIVNLKLAANALCAKLIAIENTIKQAGENSGWILSQDINYEIDRCINILTIAKEKLDQVNWATYDGDPSA
jgi:hypothetical protein